MEKIDAETIRNLKHNDVEKVLFYKIDEITTDLICCDVEVTDGTWRFHEELEGWELLLEHLEQLPNYKRDWFKFVAFPAFKRNEFVAWTR